MQELVERAADIIREGLAVDEAAPAIERKRGLEGRSLAGLQAQPAKAARASLGDDVLQYRGADALAEVIRMGAHGLDLAGSGIELLQRANSADRFALPGAPDRHARRPQAGQIEREDMAGRRIGMHARQMQAQQFLRGGAREVVYTDVHRPAHLAGGTKPVIASSRAIALNFRAIAAF